MSDLSKSLFDFARTADQLNTALRTLPMPHPLTDDDRASITANAELRQYLSLIARKAEGMASRLESTPKEAGSL